MTTSLTPLSPPPALAGYSLDFRGSIFLLILLALLCLAWAWFSYRKTVPPLAFPWRFLLGSLRALALLLLIFLIFEPSLSHRRERPLKPLLAVILDDTQSLQLQDASGTRSGKPEAQI
jgi:drug/metabolite transporter (DMT)-like permease